MEGAIMASTKLARRRDAWQVRLSPKFRRMVAAQKSAAIFVLREDSQRLILENSVFQYDLKTGEMHEYGRERLG